MNSSVLKFAKDLKVLYVEDEAIVRQITVAMLKDYFKKIDTAEDGAEGMELYSKNEYDIVLTDIAMPIMSGTIMATEMKKINPDQIIIAISGESDAAEIVKLIDLDIDYFIPKPIDKKVLKDKISRAVRSYAIHKLDDEYNEQLFRKMKEKEIQLKRENRILSNRVANVENILKFVSNYTNTGIAIMDINGNFKLVSPLYSEILGYDERELKRTSCKDHTDSAFLDATDYVFKYVREKGEIENFVKMCNTKYGTQKAISMSLKILDNQEEFFVIIKEIENPTEAQLSNSHIPFMKKEEPAKPKTTNAEEFNGRTIGIDVKITEFELIDDEFELVVNRLDGKNLKEIADVFYKLADVILSLNEFGRMYDGILSLAEALSQDVEVDSVDHLKDLLFGISDNIFQWRKGMFVESNLEDIHFYDDSIISDCIQTRNYILKEENEEESELEFF